jgi:hypothetical protein
VCWNGLARDIQDGDNETGGQTKPPVNNNQGNLREILPESSGHRECSLLTSTDKEHGVAEQQHGTKSAPVNG